MVSDMTTLRDPLIILAILGLYLAWGPLNARWERRRLTKRGRDWVAMSEQHAYMEAVARAVAAHPSRQEQT